ncbi:hypothetical protein CsSME_00053002 [Camellia sinensis var. sinensis]
MKDLEKKDVEKEPKCALYKSDYWEGHGVVVGHDGALLPSQPKTDVGRDGKLLPKVFKLLWGIHLSPKYTHDVG